MAEIEHSVITDPNIHEPKGVKFAAANTAYVADGLGSGEWKEVVLPGGVDVTPSRVYTMSGSTGMGSWTNNALIPLSFSQVESNGDVKINRQTGFLEVTKSGIYSVQIILTLSKTNSGGGWTEIDITRSRTSLSSLTTMIDDIRVIPAGDDPLGSTSGTLKAHATVSLPVGQGVGLWGTGRNSLNTAIITNTTISAKIQLTRLSDA